MDYVISPPTQASLPVQGTDARFPVRRIYCVGRNYAEHAREFGNDPDTEPPFFFSKPADAVLEDGATLTYPPQTEDLHFEAELVVCIGTGGKDIPADQALQHVFGYCAGNDVTRRDMQSVAKKMKRPWDMAKGFDLSAPCGAVVPAAEIGHPATGRISLTLDGEERQSADLSDMIWPVPDVIAFLSGLVELAPGDLIMTGTPAGVGAMVKGQTCTVTIEGVGSVTTKIG